MSDQFPGNINPVHPEGMGEAPSGVQQADVGPKEYALNFGEYMEIVPDFEGCVAIAIGRAASIYLLPADDAATPGAHWRLLQPTANTAGGDAREPLLLGGSYSPIESLTRRMDHFDIAAEEVSQAPEAHNVVVFLTGLELLRISHTGHRSHSQTPSSLDVHVRASVDQIFTTPTPLADEVSPHSLATARSQLLTAIENADVATDASPGANGELLPTKMPTYRTWGALKQLGVERGRGHVACRYDPQHDN